MFVFCKQMQHLENMIMNETYILGYPNPVKSAIYPQIRDAFWSLPWDGFNSCGYES